MTGVPMSKRAKRGRWVPCMATLAVLSATAVFGPGRGAGLHEHQPLDRRDVVNAGGRPSGHRHPRCMGQPPIPRRPGARRGGALGGPARRHCPPPDRVHRQPQPDSAVHIWRTSPPKNARPRRRSASSGCIGLFTGPYEGDPDTVGLFAPVYNLPPHPYEAAQLGFVAPIVRFGGQISLNARTESDYGLDAASYNIFHLIPVPGIDIFLWGTPASPIHDKARIKVPVPRSAREPRPIRRSRPASSDPAMRRNPSSAPQSPFLSNGTSCGETLSAILDVYLLRQHAALRRRRLAGDDGLRSAQLQPEPERAAHDRTGGRALRHGGAAEGAAVPQPERSLSV